MQRDETQITGSDFSLMNSFFKLMTDQKGRKPDRALIKQQVSAFLKQAESQGNLDRVARQMVTLIDLDNLLPASYAKFEPLLVEGMTFLLCQLPLSRLTQKIVDQLLLPANSSPGDRICVLINDMTALQKLGQVICRSPGLHPEFKKALTNLEDNVKTVSYQSLLPAIQKELHTAGPDYTFSIEKRILAEASVCAVVPAKVSQKGKPSDSQAVLKLVKPAVRQNLDRELELLDQLANFFDSNKKVWGLNKFKFRDTFNQVRCLLENETDLKSEQRNLDAAMNYYGSEASVLVPQRLPCSTAGMTVMSRVEGNKITDVEHLSQKQRRRLAEALVRTCILRPIQDLGEQSIFHGDPHAGNIAYRFQGSKPLIILYDWGMLGRLSRLQRFAFVLLAFGIETKSEMAVFYATDIIAEGRISKDSELSRNVKPVIAQVLSDPGKQIRGVLPAIEGLIEELTYQGVKFPTELLMFEKALVTLKGVQTDIDPTFNRDDYLVWAAMGRFFTDLFRLRLHRLIIEEIWTLYRYRPSKLMDVQKLIFKMGLEFGLSWFKMPLGSKLYWPLKNILRTSTLILRAAIR